MVLLQGEVRGLGVRRGRAGKDYSATYWLEKESLATRQTETTNLENCKDTRYLMITVVAYEAENKLTVGTKTRDHLKPE
jgi:hypothetical protein